MEICVIVNVVAAMKTTASITKNTTKPGCLTTTYWIHVSPASNVGVDVQIPVMEKRLLYISSKNINYAVFNM